jgi:hypothetical protein
MSGIGIVDGGKRVFDALNIISWVNGVPVCVLNIRVGWVRSATVTVRRLGCFVPGCRLNTREVVFPSEESVHGTPGQVTGNQGPKSKTWVEG